MRPSLLVLIAVVVACSASEPSELRLDLSLDKNVVARSDSVRLTLALTNTSWRPVQVLPANAYGICNHAFDVFDQAGDPVSLEGVFCMAALVGIPDPVDLAPGAQIVINDWWKPGASSFAGKPLPTGVYRLRGRAGGNGGVVYSNLQSVELHAP